LEGRVEHWLCRNTQTCRNNKGGKHVEIIEGGSWYVCTPTIIVHYCWEQTWSISSLNLGLCYGTRDPLSQWLSIY